MLGDLQELLRRLNLDLTSFANRLREVFEQPLLRAKTVTIASGATSGSVEHGLGRAHQGALIVGSTGALANAWIPPANVSGTTTVRVYVASPVASTTTVSLMVF